MSVNSRAFHSLTESNGDEGSVARVLFHIHRVNE